MARRRNRDEPDYQSMMDSAIDFFQRLDLRAQIAVVAVLLVAGLVVAFIYYRSQNPSTSTSAPSGQVNVQMLLGNPSNATPDPSNRDNYLMPKPYYALSYNDSRGTPNWVSWQLTAAYLGDAPRKQEFDPDNTLPEGFYRVTHRDYSGSGFDRGHMCPHSDRAANQEMSFSTFVMTNIIPQAPNVNRKAWAQFETYCRGLVTHDHDHLYITAGPAGKGGRGSKEFRDEIAGGRVVVPAECWKVVVAVPESGGDDDLAKVSMGTRVIAIIMPNDNDQVGEEWAKFRTSPAEVERHTGFHFFDRVRPDIAQALRQKVDDEAIAPPRPLYHGND
jgi:endonuclease G